MFLHGDVLGMPLQRIENHLNTANSCNHFLVTPIFSAENTERSTRDVVQHGRARKLAHRTYDGIDSASSNNIGLIVRIVARQICKCRASDLVHWHEVREKAHGTNNRIDGSSAGNSDLVLRGRVGENTKNGASPLLDLSTSRVGEHGGRDDLQRTRLQQSSLGLGASTTGARRLPEPNGQRASAQRSARKKIWDAQTWWPPPPEPGSGALSQWFRFLRHVDASQQLQPTNNREIRLGAVARQPVPNRGACAARHRT
mmetsp:Transcript_45962/g.121865  ORF Transcript_45962/g.121865 Transcript_45962/m.121865 type:complete len:256 (-) Transcript_45962:230-997(-)